MGLQFNVHFRHRGPYLDNRTEPVGWLVGWLVGSRLYVPLPVGQMKGR